MKRTIKFLIIIMSLLLIGCGKMQDESLNTMQESSYETQSDENGVENELMDDGELNNEETADDDEAEDDEGDYTEDEEVEATGIIAMICRRPSNHHNEIHEAIISINPDNGQTQCVAEFSYHGQDLITDWQDFQGYANFRNKFSSDYTKRAATKIFTENNSLHAGWIDINGDFFDVSEEAGDVSDSDFADPPCHRAYGFAWDGKFVYETNRGFSENSDGRFTYHIVDLDDISEGSYVEKKLKNWDKYACFKSAGFGGNDPGLYPTDWLDDTHCLADEGNASIDILTLHKNSVIYDTKTKEITKYISGESRNNWSGVASPDGKKIAFLSTANTADVDLYITSPKGGEPKKLNVETTDDWELKLERGNQESYCTLLDWK